MRAKRSQNPCEIPHFKLIPPRYRVGVAFNMFFSDTTEHFPVTPAGESEYRYEHRRNQSSGSASSGWMSHPTCQAGIHHRAGRHHKWEHSDTRRQNNAGGVSESRMPRALPAPHTGEVRMVSSGRPRRRKELTTGSGIIKSSPAGASFTRHFFSQRVRGGMMINRGCHDNHQYYYITQTPASAKHTNVTNAAICEVARARRCSSPVRICG